jgi:hypothetical protein
VNVLAPEFRVAEQRLPRVHVHGAAVAQGESGRVVHPGVDRDDEEGPGHARDRDGDSAGEVDPGPQPVPAVGVDAEEDGLHEEREALQREAQAEDVPEVGYPLRPQHAELEGEDGPGDHAHREQREHDPRPALGKDAVEVIAGAQVPVLGEQDQHGERDAEAHQRDVNGQGQRLHLARLEQVVLLRAHEPYPTPYYYGP